MHLDVDALVDSAAAYYFPFEDLLRAVLLAFSRDDGVRANAAVRAHAPLPALKAPPANTAAAAAAAGAGAGATAATASSAAAGPAAGAVAAHLSPLSHAANLAARQALEQAAVASPWSVTVPLSGVLPFKGMASYAAPLALVYGTDAAVAAVLKAMWQRHWCKLNSLRSGGGCLPQLAQQFEELVQLHDPTLFLHLMRHGVQPLTVAMPWLHSAFVSLLPPGEVLVLWDRILAADGLDLLPVLAAAVFVYRARAAKDATSSEELAAVFCDGVELKVAPLLQHFLFPSPVPAAVATAH